MLKYGNKEYRNIQEQVQKNKDDLSRLVNGTSAYGIIIKGVIETEGQLPTEDLTVGDAYLVGTENNYELYIYNADDPWINCGSFPTPGPEGPVGPKGDKGDAGSYKAGTNITIIDDIISAPSVATKNELNSGLNKKQDIITTSNKLSASLIDGLAAVATTGSYEYLLDKPTNLVTLNTNQDIGGYKSFKNSVYFSNQPVFQGGSLLISNDDEKTYYLSDGTIEYEPDSSTEYVYHLPSASGTIALTSDVDKKQDIISDLATIRSGAAKGATAIQFVTKAANTNNTSLSPSYGYMGMYSYYSTTEAGWANIVNASRGIFIRFGTFAGTSNGTAETVTFSQPMQMRIGDSTTQSSANAISVMIIDGPDMSQAGNYRNSNAVTAVSATGFTYINGNSESGTLRYLAIGVYGA